MYKYYAKILSVYDGDGTFKTEIDLGLNQFTRKSIRLSGIDCPEIKGEQREAGLIVRNFVRLLILDKEVIIETSYDKSGKYGRLLVNLFIDGVNLSDMLLELNFAKPYTGTTKEKWTQKELDRIINGI